MSIKAITLICLLGVSMGLAHADAQQLHADNLKIIALLTPPEK